MPFFFLLFKQNCRDLAILAFLGSFGSVKPARHRNRGVFSEPAILDRNRRLAAEKVCLGKHPALRTLKTDAISCYNQHHHSHFEISCNFTGLPKNWLLLKPSKRPVGSIFRDFKFSFQFCSSFPTFSILLPAAVCHMQFDILEPAVAF